MLSYRLAEHRALGVARVVKLVFELVWHMICQAKHKARAVASLGLVGVA